MMKAVIVEDERIAAQNLKRLLAEVDSDVTVAAVLQSVEETVEFFSQSNDIDLVFMDIHLADGLAFLIFDKVTINCPIVFTTAYDQYAIEAFKIGGIDYLLKPINKEDLARSVNRVRQRVSSAPLSKDTLAEMAEMLQPHRYKSYFLIPVRDKLVPLKVDDIAYFYIDDKMTRAVTFDGTPHAIDKPLENILAQLDPARFFRANRQYIISHKAVKDISLWPLSKLYVSLSLPTPEKIIVPRARAGEFKDWYTN